MKCPNCNYTFNNGDICPECGMDAVLFKKTKDASNKLYNKGLSQAKAKDLSGAIVSLRQSVTFDKMNYKARNLLGLVYFEKGQPGDALKQWIIGASLYKSNEIAKEYIDSLQKNPRVLEKLNDSVRMYNQARTYLSQKSEDLAVIQLKKAVDSNPKFVEAFNLLTLCYIKQKDIIKAKECIEKTLEMDVNNPIALSYAAEIGTSKVLSFIADKNDKKSEVVRSTVNSSISRKEFKTRSGLGKSEIIAFILGIVCTAAVLFTLVMPAWVQGKDEKIKNLQTEVSNLESENKTGTSEFAKSFKSLQEENEKLKADNKKYKSAEALQTKVNKINESSALSKERKYEEAAIALSNIDTVGLADDVLANYNSIKADVYPRAAESFYNKGKSAYLNNNYDESSVALENCLKFSSDEVFVDDAIYYLGKVSQNKGDNEKAKTYFEKVINEFPNSNQLKNAKNSLSSL